MAVVSPCIGICALDRTTDLCRGCKRTLEEIAGWMRMNDEQRLAVIAALPERPASSPVGSNVRASGTATQP